MISVLLRHELEEDGRLLGIFEPAHLPQITQRLREYPTYANGETCKLTAAQFVIGDKGAFFEIVVGE